MPSNLSEDDPTIANTANLWRRIPPEWIVWDENSGRLRPTSKAFQDHPDGTPMSVLLADVVTDSGRTAEDVLVGHSGYSLVCFCAGFARQCGQGVARDPNSDEPAHAVVFGKKTGSVRSRLAKAASWVIYPSRTR